MFDENLNMRNTLKLAGLFFVFIGVIFSSCQKSVDSSAADIEALKASVLALQKTTDSLAKALAATNNNVANLSAKVDSIKAQIVIVQNQITILNTQLTTTNANITVINAQIVILNQQYITLLAQLNAILAQLSVTPTSLSNGLVAFYPFTGNANDSSGNGNDGIINGAILTSDRLGNLNSAYSFNGYQEITAPDKNYLNITGDMSISAWFYSAGPPTFRTSHTIVTKRVSIDAGMPYLLCINYQYGINNNSDYKKPMFVSDFSYSYGYQYLQSTIDVTNNKWCHLVCTISGTTLKIYLDGLEILSTPVDNTKRVANNGSLIIGGGARIDKPAEEFVGNLDEVRIYNRALTQQEITYLATH